MTELRCDFCYDLHPEHVFGCKPFNVFGFDVNDHRLVEIRYDDEWYACQTCAKFIEQASVDELAKRAAEKMNRSYEQIRLLHAMFMEHQTGAKREITEAL